MKLFDSTFRFTQWLASHALLLFIVWSLWLTFPHFGFGPWSYVSAGDEAAIVLPAKLTFALNSRLGYWSAQWVSGVDRSAAPFTSDLDSVLFVLLPGWLAYGLVKWLQAFVAGYFSFRLLRDSLDVDTTPSLYVGIAFSSPGFPLYDGLGVSGLPFFLWGISRASNLRSWLPHVCAIGLGFFLAVNSVYFVSMFLLPTMFFWFLFVESRAKPHIWKMLFLFTGAWFLGEIPTLWSSFVNAPLSHKAQWDLTLPRFGTWQDRLSAVLEFVVRYSMPIALALIGLIVSRGRDRRHVSLFAGLVFFLALIPGAYLFQVMAHNHLGFLSGFQFSRITKPLRFLAVVSGGVGVHLVASQWRLSLMRGTSSGGGIPLRTLLLTGAIGVVVWQSLIMKWDTFIKQAYQGYMYSNYYAQPELRQLARSSKPLSPFRVVTICNPPAFAWAHGLETADGYVNLYPRRYQEYWGQVIALVTEADRAAHDEFHLWGNRVYLYAPQGVCTSQREFRVKDYYDLKLLSLANVRYIVSTRDLQDEDLTLLPSNIRDEMLAWRKHRKRGVLVRLRGVLEGKYQGIPVYIYENREVLARFFLVSRAQLFDDHTEVLAALRNASYADLRSTAYLRRTDVAGVRLNPLGGKNGQVILRSYSSDRISLGVKVEAPVILIATNNYSPYWKAVVDGSATRIFPVDHTFQGVYVEGGEHEVVLEYVPPYAVRFLGGRP